MARFTGVDTAEEVVPVLAREDVLAEGATALLCSWAHRTVFDPEGNDDEASRKDEERETPDWPGVLGTMAWKLDIV